MMRHTNGQIRWTQRGAQNHATYPLDAAGARYTIDRWAGEPSGTRTWVISYLPGGIPAQGREKVPWIDERRTLAAARSAVAADYVRRAGLVVHGAN